MLSLILILGGGLRAEGFDPALTKVMSQAEFFDTKPFAGDVHVNASGQWIAASQYGVFLSDPSYPTYWTEIRQANGDPIVTSTTVNIQCRISDSGSWVIINRAGIYKSSSADPTIAEAVTNTVGINQVYDVDMSPNGRWIASSSQGTWTFNRGTGTASLVLTSGNPGNGSLSTRRIVKINSNGDWVIMTTSGVYKNGTSVLTNPSISNIGGNIAYWSLDLNDQGDWVAINSKGTFLNGTRITVDPNPDSSTTIEANDVGEMVVEITDRNLSDEFIWMAISPHGIYRDGVRLAGLNFSTNQQQYALDLNNSGVWVAASENAALLNGTPITLNGTPIQTNNGMPNELLCKINDFSDYVCLTNIGVFRNEDRGITNAKVALASSEFTPTSFKHVVFLGSNGAVTLLSEHTVLSTKTGVYWGGNVVIPPPPQPVGASLIGNTVSWNSGGGSTAAYLVSVSTFIPAKCTDASNLYFGNDHSFTVNEFSNFMPGELNYISLCSINSNGDECTPLIFEYQAPLLQVTGHAIDHANQQVTLSWSSLPGKGYRIEKSLDLAEDWQPLTEIPPGNAATSTATTTPADWNMTRTFNDPGMTTKGFYRIKTAP